MTWTKLSGKTVAVTGGAAGIGLAVAEGFAEVGANLLLADFAEDQGNQEERESHDLPAVSDRPYGGYKILPSVRNSRSTTTG